MQNFLNIRNLTSLAITLDSVQRYRTRKVASWDDLEATCLCGLKGDKSDPGDATDPAEVLHVSVTIPGFDTRRTEIEINKDEHLRRSGVENFRLTFSDQRDRKYKVNISTAWFNSQELVPIDKTGQTAFIMYHPSGSLAVFSRRDPKSWMKQYPDRAPLSVLSIPGTHNSPTCYKALPSVRCQVVSPREQLENGVRFLDVRVQVDEPDDKRSDELTLVHSNFPIALSGSKKFKPFYQEILAFLKSNPSETIILSLKREGCGKATDAHLAQRLYDHYIDSEHWVMANGIPKLGDARGKIVLFRRFNLNATMRERYGEAGGIDASSWADNTANSKAGDVHIQDFYEVLQTENIEKKTTYVLEHCRRAASSNEVGHSTSSGWRNLNGPLFVNFLTASNFWKPGCWPEKIAKKINPAVTRFLCEEHDVGMGRGDANGGVGVLVCDWVGDDGDWDLVKLIIGLNERLLAKRVRGNDRPLTMHAYERVERYSNGSDELSKAGAARRRREIATTGASHHQSYRSDEEQGI